MERFDEIIAAQERVSTKLRKTASASDANGIGAGRRRIPGTGDRGWSRRKRFAIGHNEFRSPLTCFPDSVDENNACDIILNTENDQVDPQSEAP